MRNEISALGVKKLLIIVLVFIGIFLIPSISYAECPNDINAEFEVWQALDDCLKWSKLVNWANADINAWWGVANKIKIWVDNIALYLWIFAVWSIVYWWLMMTLSAWEDEKIKKAKDIVKWGIIWFLWLISASAIISLVVKIMYSL